MKLRDVLRLLKRDAWARMIPMQYLVIVEKGETGYGAYVPDLPGCAAAADTREEVVELIRQAIEFHIESMRADGESIPEPTSQGEWVDVNAA